MNEQEVYCELENLAVPPEAPAVNDRWTHADELEAFLAFLWSGDFAP